MYVMLTCDTKEATRRFGLGPMDSIRCSVWRSSLLRLAQLEQDVLEGLNNLLPLNRTLAEPEL